MSWYKLVLKQIQSIHIGKFEWGVVSETEIFIPGWTMWGALVNTYIVENKINNIDKVKEIQKAFETITNFFPSFNGNGILEPQYKDGEFIYTYKNKNGETQIITEEEFRYKYVKADFKTSIEPVSRKAKDEHLYEFEYIVPEFYWIGVIKIENKEVRNFLNSKLQIFIGGDTRYGYGLLKVKTFKEINENELSNWNLKGNGTLTLERTTKLRNFVEFKNNISFEGELKLIPELNFRENIPKLIDAKYFMSIGSIIKNSSNLDGSSYKLNKGKFTKC